MGHRYQQVDIATATPEALIAKLLAGAIRSARQARDVSGAGAAADRGRAISKAIAIIGELRSSLDHERGGEIAANLESLYDFVLDRLLQANLRQSQEALDEAIGILTPLEEAWAEIARQPPQQAAG